MEWSLGVKLASVTSNSMTLPWTQNGKLVVDSDGKAILCPACPCRYIWYQDYEAVCGEANPTFEDKAWDELGDPVCVSYDPEVHDDLAGTEQVLSGLIEETSCGQSVTWFEGGEAVIRVWGAMVRGACGDAPAFDPPAETIACRIYPVERRAGDCPEGEGDFVWANAGDWTTTWTPCADLEVAFVGWDEEAASYNALPDDDDSGDCEYSYFWSSTAP